VEDFGQMWPMPLQSQSCCGYDNIENRVLISGCGNSCSRVAIYDIVENDVANATAIVVTLQFGNIENHYTAV
jgi:hypothetical protein